MIRRRGSNKDVIAVLLSLAVSLTACQQAVTSDDADIELGPQAVGPVVNPSLPYVTNFQGFGTSLAWGATIVGTWSDANRTAIADALFTPSGLNFNIARYLVSAGQNPNGAALGCKAMRTGAVPASFNPEPNQWDWNADPGQRWFLQAAVDREASFTEAFFSSPPYWMTVSGCTNGNATGNVSNVPADKYDDYAEYMVTILEHFDDTFRLPFTTASPMNEPNAAWWDKDSADHQGTHMSQMQQEQLILEFAQSLQSKGLTIGISASDANHSQGALDNFNGYSQAAKNALAQVNTHTYNYLAPSGDYSSLSPLHNAVKTQNKTLWQSEFGTAAGDFAERNSVTGALNLAKRMTDDLNNLRPDAWVFWDGIENLAVNQATDTSWGLIYANYDASGETWYRVKMYYGMAQFSRYIEPGMSIIGSGDANTVAAHSASNERLVLVVHNSLNTTRSVTYNLSKFTLPAATSSVFRTSDTQNAVQVANVNLTNSALAVQLPPRSITTYVINSASANNTPVQLISQVSNKCASIDSWSTADSADILQWACGTGSTNQLWRLQRMANGFYQVRSQHSNKCMSVADWSTTDGADIIQWACGSGSANQLWKPEAAPNHQLYLRSSLSNKCASIADWSTADGADILQWTCGSGSANQLWRFE